MQPKSLLRRTLLIIVLTGFTLSVTLLFYFISRSSSLPAGRQAQRASALLAEKAVALSKSEQASFGLPVRLKIPGINVDSAVEYVGLTSDGAMDVPKSPADVGWFNLGQYPGESGSAVMAGHYGLKNGKASVFDNLYKLQKGDKLYVENEKGITTTFVVRESRRYDPEANASDVFGSNDGESHLNLITCDGVWDKVAKSFSKRLVVFTDKEMGR